MFDRNLLVVDVETSGSNTELSSVLQIGAIKLSQDLNQIDRPWLAILNLILIIGKPKLNLYME